MQNIAIVSQGTGKYLFSLPDNVTLKEGDRVKCSTKRGITDGVAFADSAWVDENISQLLGKLTGAKFPLKPVVGKLEYHPFEKPQDKPAANLANKYEGMSSKELDLEMCEKKGACSAINSSHRKNDCPLIGMESCDITDANRAEVIEYLLEEDAANEKPQGKQEPIKLYCVEDWNGGKWIAKGKVYGTDERGRFVYEDGSTTKNTFVSVKDVMRSAIGRFCVPLVKRPAKVGEYVLLDSDDCFHKNKQGDVVEVVKVFKKLPDTTSRCFINDPTLEYSSGICVSFENNYSYVLDGYRPAPEPEKEPEPEYYNGKVVCVESHDECFIVGKMYEFVNGEIKDDEGDKRPMFEDRRFKSVDEWNEAYGSPLVRFIEFKGEAHD